MRWNEKVRDQHDGITVRVEDLRPELELRDGGGCSAGDQGAAGLRGRSGSQGRGRWC